MKNKQLIKETILLIISLLCFTTAFIFSSINNESSWYVVLLFGAAFAIGGFAKAKEGIQATINDKALNVEILMILAALGAFFIGYYSEGAILILIFSISGVMESYATSKSEKALTNLLKLAPQKAHLLQDGKEIEVKISDLKIGDVVIVKVGSQIPVDGHIVHGTTSIDQSAITGEFTPAYKGVGDDVYAGSINLDGTIQVETGKDPKDSVVQKIIDLVKGAQTDHGKSHSKIEQFEKVYVYIVILLSLAFMVIPTLFNFLSFHESFYRGIIVLVVGSPCALVASISPAMLSSLSNAAHKRILIKGGSHLETLSTIKAVVFDKTGTITSGKPKVINFELESTYDQKEVIGIIQCLESKSNHPLAKAIVSHFENIESITCSIETNEVSGRGMQANINGNVWQIGRFGFNTMSSMIEESYQSHTEKGHSIALIIHNQTVIGFVALKDTVRTLVKETVVALNKRGLKTIMLTGDNYVTAKAIAEEANITHYESDCFPEDKVEKVKLYQKSIGPVMMIGDGINDAPALATAEIGVAMGTGTDVSIETADIIFMNDNLTNITKTLDLAKRMKKIIYQNVFFSITVISILMISNLFGAIQLPIGVVAHEMSTILVILNSLRLLFK
jgi:Zn2+/Cd2+-exporting ATPase